MCAPLSSSPCASHRREWDDREGSIQGQVKEEPFGDVLTDPGDVELAIRRAQKAVLNPGAKDAPCSNLPRLLRTS
eukprot:scaffold125174_cov23-Tisochrysis_lutea.AAC.3